MGCDGSGCCGDSPVKMGIQFLLQPLSAHAIFLIKYAHINALISYTIYVLVDRQASIQTILICIPSLKHILGLLSLTKLRSRCNRIHLY